MLIIKLKYNILFIVRGFVFIFLMQTKHYTMSQKVDHQLMVITLSKPNCQNSFTVGKRSKL